MRKAGRLPNIQLCTQARGYTAVFGHTQNLGDGGRLSEIAARARCAKQSASWALWLAPGVGRYDELLDIGGEELAVDRYVEQAWSIDPVVAQDGDEGQRAPLAEGRLGMEPLAPPRPTMGAGHIGLGPGLIDKDEARGSKLALILLPPQRAS